MVILVRRADVLRGKGQEAVPWALKVAAYLNEHFKEHLVGEGIQVLLNISGKIDQLRWVGSFESLAEVETLMHKYGEDAQFSALTAEGADLVENECVTYFKTVP